MSTSTAYDPAESTPPARGPRVEFQGASFDVRESMRALPAALQLGLTWLTGKALPDQKGWRLRPADHLVASIIPLVAGLGIGAVSVYGSGWWLLALPFSWLLTVHGMRKLATMILHQCTHGNYALHKRINNFLGRTIAVMLLAQEYVDYKREHVADHHSSKHMTLLDPTAQFIVVTMGCVPGMPQSAMWRAMFRTIFSPRFHVGVTYGRLASHFRGTSVAHRILMSLLLISEGAVITALNAWLFALIVWVIPLTVLFNVAAVLRLSCRHLFPAANTEASGRTAVAASTHGIFLGERVPDSRVRGTHKIWAWAIWWFRMCLVHLPARLFVLVGDGPCHDYHHRFPKAKEWPNYLFARRDDIAAGHPSWPAYTEVWGLRAAIDAVFSSLVKADPANYDPDCMPEAGAVIRMAPFKE